jgi:hypothetical protein
MAPFDVAKNGRAMKARTSAFEHQGVSAQVVACTVMRSARSTVATVGFA